jgi:hypothetical protein
MWHVEKVSDHTLGFMAISILSSIWFIIEGGKVKDKFHDKLSMQQKHRNHSGELAMLAEIIQ